MFILWHTNGRIQLRFNLRVGRPRQFSALVTSIRDLLFSFSCFAIFGWRRYCQCTARRRDPSMLGPISKGTCFQSGKIRRKRRRSYFFKKNKKKKKEERNKGKVQRPQHGKKQKNKVFRDRTILKIFLFPTRRNPNPQSGGKK